MSPFKGKWICRKEFLDLKPINVFHREVNPDKDYTHRDDLKNLHTLFKKEFDFYGAKKVIIRLTADDYFKLYINGEFVGQGPTAGYPFCYYYNEFDVTNLLNNGKNEVLVHNYYQGHVNRVWNSGDYRMGMIADIIADGNIIASTDETWLYCPLTNNTGDCDIGYETGYSECIDSRILPHKFTPCFVKNDVDYTFNTAPSVNLQVYEKKAIEVKDLENGGYFLDFGQEITATLKVTAVGNCGDKVLIHYGEELNADGTVRYDTRCYCHYEDTLILNGGESKFEGYDYKAFRYAEILPQGKNISVKDVTAVVRHYPFDDSACTIKSSSEVLDAVFNICKNGVKYGSQDIFVDCPSREKGQYAGDLTVTGASHIYLTGDIRLFEKAIINQAQSQSISNGILAVTPGSLMQEIADYSLQFPILLLRHYMHTGDKEFLKSMLPVCEKMLAHFKQFDRGDGMLELVDTWNLVDWPQNLRDNYDFPLTNPIGAGAHNVMNAFYVGSVSQVEQIKDILGIPYENQSKALKEKFNSIFFNKEIGLYVDSEGSKHSSLHANVIPLYYGLEPDSATDSVANYVAEKGLVCGVYMAYFYLKSLAKAKRYDAVWKALVSEGTASWYNMVKEGGTTCFEAWGVDQKFNTSLCHPWASGPVSVIIEDILGLAPKEFGWDEPTLTPHLPETESIEMTIPLVNGKKIKITAKGNKGEIKL